MYVSAIAAAYATTETDSQIVKRYAETKDVNFNIRSMNRHLKVKPEDIITELEGDEDNDRK